MANKIVAVFLMCIVLAAAISVEARKHPVNHFGLRPVLFSDDEPTYGNPVNTESLYKGCFVQCERNCPHLQGQYTDCEMKCDTNCSAEEFAAKLHIKE